MTTRTRHPGPSPKVTFVGLRPASARATAAARASSKKRDTRCELILRQALWKVGLRYRVAVGSLPGKPDIVFARERLAIFCDGDFWHGRDLERRLEKLEKGHNSSYWTAKVMRNVERDREHTAALTAAGWMVLRFWETEILEAPEAVAQTVNAVLLERRRGADRQGKQGTA